MAMPFSFKHSIDPKVHKIEEDIKAIAVEGDIGQSPNQMMKLAGSDLKTKGYYLNI